MAAKKKGTLIVAQAAFMRALRDVEEAVMGLGSDTPKRKAKKAAKKRTTKKKRTRIANDQWIARSAPLLIAMEIAVEREKTPLGTPGPVQAIPI